jgi:hypothetical protein
VAIQPCSSCAASIRFVQGVSGKWWPVNAYPDATGRVQLVDGRAVVLKALQAPNPRLPLYRAHWADCPGAAKHRRSKESNATRNDAAPASGESAGGGPDGPKQGSLFK